MCDSALHQGRPNPIRLNALLVQMARKVIGVKWKSEVCKSSPRNRPVWIPPMSDRFHRTFILSTNTLFIHPFPNPVKALQGSYSPKTKTRRFLSRPSCGLDGSSSPNDFTSRTLKQSEVCSLAAKLTDVGSSSLTEIDKIESGFIFKRNDKPQFQIAEWHLCCQHLENAADEIPAKQTVQTSNHKGGWFLSKPPTKSRQRNPKPLSVHASCRDFSSSDLKTPFLFRAIREIATGQSSGQTIIVIQA